MNDEDVVLQLVGKTITGLRVNDEQDLLVFDTTSGPVGLVAYGDCCSQSWFADITGVDALIGNTVLSAETIDMPESVQDDRCRQDYDQFYGIKLTTQRGFVDIVFRNSSNGYYGGYLEVFTKDLPKDLSAITSDWSA